MKKNTINKSVFLLVTNKLIVLSFVFVLLSCGQVKYNSDEDLAENLRLNKVRKTGGFVYMEDGVFKVDGEKYFPVILNYIIVRRIIDGEYVISPPKHYEDKDRYEAMTKAETHEQLQRHFKLIEEMGFNVVRITFDKIHFTAETPEVIAKETQEILSELEHLMSVAKENNLRIFLLLTEPFKNIYETLAKEILKHFNDNTSIFAYDFFNEPLYFDEVKDRLKEDALQVVRNWRSWMREYAPNHLFTIAFGEPIEVFEWDPSILPVDFVEVHTYNPLRVKGEVYWFSKYVGKPWIIGETSLPADNDSISYDEQKLFAKEFFEYAIDCGAIGVGWWDFQDLEADTFEAAYSGIMNHKDTTYTIDNQAIIGTVKPAV
jgi:hypothetical protein